MNQKKNKKILLIIIIILIILILFIGAAFAYFATDIFKSDKELFFKYISQIGDPEKGFIDKDLSKYLEKRNSVAFNNQGELTVNISENGNEDKYKNVNNFKIEFSGQVDKQNEKVFQNISLNYSDNVNQQLNYKQVGSKYGIQNNNVGSKYIAIDVNNLDKFSQSDTTVEEYTKGIQKIQDISKIETNKEQLENIFNTYKNVLNEEIDSQCFSKVKDQNLEGYKLSLEGENFKNISIKLLETLKNDQTGLEKVNEFLKSLRNSNKLTTNDIDDFIEQIQDSNDIDNKKIEIIVYKENNSIAKISIGVDNDSISVEKNAKSNSQNFTFEVKQKNDVIFMMNMQFDGLQSIQNVQENFKVQFNIDEYTKSNLSDSDESISTINKKIYKYNLKNDINFTYDTDIEEFTDENSVVLTKYSPESIGNFIDALIQRVKEVNKRDMQELGISENENPIIQVISPIGIFTSNAGMMGNLNNGTSEMEVNTFNSKFEMYQNTNSSPQTVKGLLSTISLNNESGEGYKIKEINFEGEEYDASEQNITYVKSDIDTSKNYRVEFEKDKDTGIIYRVIINSR